MNSNENRKTHEDDTLVHDLLNDIIRNVENEEPGPCCSTNQNSSSTMEIYRRTCFFNSTSDICTVAPTKAVKSANLPPSYSTVLKMGPAVPEYRRHIRSAEGPQFGPNLRILRSALSQYPFVGRIPPPSYGELHGEWSTGELSHHSSEELILGPEPTLLWCARCRTIVITQIRCQRTKFTHFVAATLCVFGCWPCCLLPYCINSCKAIHHTCPYCNYLFGSYTPW